MNQNKVRIAVMTDVHGNLPALEASLKEIKDQKCDFIYHTGDAIAIGPYTSECMNLLINQPNLKMIMGNHDQWSAFGIPNPRPHWMTDGEIEHEMWVHASLDKSLIPVIEGFPYVMEEKFFDLNVTFLHYGHRESQKEFGLSIENPTIKDLDDMFQRFNGDIVFYGHNHSPSDVFGKARYINPGSLGCNREPIARFVILECSYDGYKIEYFRIPYDNSPIFEAFKKRDVPQRRFIMENFFGKK